MKKSLLTLLIILSFSFFLFPSTSHAISIENLPTAIDKTTAKKGNTANQISFLKTLQTLLQSPSFTTSAHAQLFSELEQYTANKIKTLQTQPPIDCPSQGKCPQGKGVIKKSDWTNHIHIPNVNSQKVREAMLGRHNAERIAIGATPYGYHSDLEKAATTRAKVLNAEARTSNTHGRKSGDGYYNYTSIMEWFNNLGIYFPNAGGGRTAFSESVGRGYYKCSSNDCTDSLITAIKTTWDNLIMKEKNHNGAHYRSATMPHFTQMGMGISIDTEKNRYYLVLHYSMDVVE